MTQRKPSGHPSPHTLRTDCSDTINVTSHLKYNIIKGSVTQNNIVTQSWSINTTP